MMEIIIFILTLIGVTVIGMVIAFFTTDWNPDEVAKLAIKGILASKGWTYRNLWQHAYGDKEIVCLEDLTHEQMIELIKVGN